MDERPEPSSAIGQLPDLHRQLLKLLADGTAPATVAERLGIDVESIAPLLTVAAAKLARLARPPRTPRGDGPTVTRSS